MVALTLGLSTVQVPYSLDNDFETALGTAGLSTRTARFDSSMLRFFRQGEFETPIYESAIENPWRVPFLADMWRRQFNPNAGKTSEALANGSRMLGPGTRRTLLGNPIQVALDNAAKPGALLEVLQSMKRRGLIRSEIPSLAEVPKEIQQAAAAILYVALDVLPYRRAAFARVADLPSAFDRIQKSELESTNPEDIARDLTFMRATDLAFLLAAAHDLTLVATESLPFCQAVSPTRAYSWSVDTDWGEIAFSGGSDSKHKDRPILLLIDTGGADVFVNCPSNQSVNNWASVCIDTVGNDKYVSHDALVSTAVAKWDGRKNQRTKFGPGSGCFGYGILIDAEGNDLYRSHRPGLASASYGAAVLLDKAGNDVYDAYTNGEGFGYFGVAVLEELKGDDNYQGFAQVQGHGQVQGFGMVLDREGNDTYVANDETLDFPSPQSKDHNVSMAQGAGNGRRADYLDGHSLAGGIGILFDQAGSDSYSCGVFGQGVGYWEGVGFLWDTAGDDKYFGQWYVQGAAAHFALGYLEDEQGSDVYSASMNMAQGAGHDFSVGLLFEHSGNDTYKAPNLSLGAGNANGIGVFLDVLGNDGYSSQGITLGRGAEAPKGSLRERCLCLGVFMDLAGKDAFPEVATWAKDGVKTVNWTDKGSTPAEAQLGIFWDRGPQ